MPSPVTLVAQLGEAVGNVRQAAEDPLHRAGTAGGRRDGAGIEAQLAVKGVRERRDVVADVEPPEDPDARRPRPADAGPRSCDVRLPARAGEGSGRKRLSAGVELVATSALGRRSALE